METILLVDDDAEERSAIRASLCRGPYDLIDADNPQKALEIARSVHIDLLIVATMLPSLNGRTLACRIGQVRPDVKVLFVTCSPESQAIGLGIFPPGAYALSHPITAEGLLPKVKGILKCGEPWLRLSRCGPG